jgi:hypothetical protein
MVVFLSGVWVARPSGVAAAVARAAKVRAALVRLLDQALAVQQHQPRKLGKRVKRASL